MPNLYITPQEIKDTIPDLMEISDRKYDDAFIRFAEDVSRQIDNWCKRTFYPVSEARIYNRTDPTKSYIDDVLSVSQLRYSEDNGATYTALAESGNWLLKRGRHFSHPGSYDKVVIDPNGTTITAWPPDLRALEITGIFGYADDRSDCWEDSGDAVQDAGGINDTVTTIEVSDDTGKAVFGTGPRFSRGMLIRTGTEYHEVTNVQDKQLTVIRGRNGTTAASQANGIQIDIWRPPSPVRGAARIQTVRSHMRATQGYADSRANAEIGQLFFLKKMDPEAQELLMNYRRRQVPARA
jgi:hypothetical protein